MRPEVFNDMFFQGDIVSAGTLLIVLCIFIAGVLSVFFIFFGGIKFITSGGDDEKVKASVSTIRHAVFGLLIVIFSVSIVSILGNIFQFDLLGGLNWNRMQTVFHTFTDRLTNESTIIYEDVPVLQQEQYPIEAPFLVE